MLDHAERVTIGKIERPFGVRGEVKVQSLSDVPGRFNRLKDVTLVAPAGDSLTTTVTHVRSGGRSYIMGFEAFTTPEEAARFRGAWLQIPRSASPSLADGLYYEYDLLGMTVMDENRNIHGTVEEILESSGNHIFVVRRKHQELLIPALKTVIAAVDLVGRVMTIRAGMVESS
jgi:16S rRNA processing protein RimM